MKTKLFLLSLLPCAFCLRLWGQYSIDWYTINGGGGTSTNSQYSLAGTIGQSDAGAVSGGNFSLSGGFWGTFAAVQTPGAPYLWIMRTSTNTVCVWWAASDIHCQLQGTTSLAATDSVWTAYAYTTNGANCVYVEPVPAGSKFYRLKQ